MKSAQSMFRPARRAPRARHAPCIGVLGAVLLAWCTAGVGCSSSHRPTSASGLLTAPYNRPIVVAVAPLLNESGTSLVDELAISDALVNTIGQIDGVSSLPINRTLAVMRAMSLALIEDEGAALALANELGADAIVVGVITAWDPYDPPVVGMNLAYFGRASVLNAGVPQGFEPRDLQMASTDQPARQWSSGAGPLSTSSLLLDASSNGVRERVRLYAATQGNERSAIGWRRHMASMDLYTKFACHELVNRLLASEWARIGDPVVSAEVDSRR